MESAPWFAVNAPTLTALGPEGREKHKLLILARAEAILTNFDLRYRIDFCFALEEAATQLREEGVI